MVTTDETELLDEFRQTWEGLEETLLRAALALDFRGNLSQVLDISIGKTFVSLELLRRV